MTLNKLSIRLLRLCVHRYGIDAMSAMAQGLFASLLIGTIIKTLGQQTGIDFLVNAGTYASSVAGPTMAASIGYALHAPQLVLFSLIAVGASANELGGAGGPLAVYLIAIVASEVGKLVSKETKVDILVTPAVTILVGVGLSVLCAPAIGAAASSVGNLIMWATELQPFLMGILLFFGILRRTFLFRSRLVMEMPASWNTPSSIYVYSVLSDTLISGWF